MTIDEAEKIKMVVEQKEYIVQLIKTVANAMIEAFENLKIEDVNMFRLGYNKAIDDFVNEAKKRLIKVSTTKLPHKYLKAIGSNELVKIAEQLKEQIGK